MFQLLDENDSQGVTGRAVHRFQRRLVIKSAAPVEDDSARKLATLPVRLHLFVLGKGEARVRFYRCRTFLAFG